MLFLNLNRLFYLRGITNPHRFLVQNGFSANISQRILHNQKTTIKMQHLLRLCELLRCTPNDLFDFQLGKNKFIDKDHPLHSLKKQPIPVNLQEYFKEASFNEIEELQNLALQQKQKKKLK
jgi:DNA-binding Xre family transcriptional regulator